jgi:CRP/FNR family cyclic AMP-dependent transcriptional regulator
MSWGDMRLLKSFDIFGVMTDSAIAAFQRAAVTQRFRAGEVLYLQGDKGQRIYRIANGEVRLSFCRSDGREACYVVFGPGDCFGESNCVDGFGRPQTARARTDVCVQVVNKADIDCLRQKHESVNQALLELLAYHMRVLIELFADVSLNDLEERIARRILDAIDAAHICTSVGKIPVQLSQSELADMVGASRQSVNKILQHFCDEHLITTEYGGLVVEALDRLRLKAFDGGLSSS